MAKFLCLCGSSIRTSGSIPHPYQWMLLADSDFDESLDTDGLYMRSRIAFLCPECQRLWVYWDGLAEPATLYDPQGRVERSVPAR